MKNSTRAAAVTVLIDRKVRAMGGCNLVIDAAVRVGMVCLDYNHSACRSIENGISAGAKILDGGCHVNG